MIAVKVVNFGIEAVIQLVAQINHCKSATVEGDYIEVRERIRLGSGSIRSSLISRPHNLTRLRNISNFLE